MDGTAALIHFVGLFVFTLQPSIQEREFVRSARKTTLHPSATVVAIVPPVHQPGGPQTERTATRGSRPSPIDWSAGIEGHTPLIAYKQTWDPEPVVKGWTPNLLWTSDEGEEWMYIALSGERISFQTGGANNPPFPAGLKLDLPTITSAIGEKRDLLKGYSPPDYPSAAAVITIPGGTLASCSTLKGRVDTEITLATNGTLTISAAGGEKSLILPGDATVFFANVPLSFAMHQHTGLDAGHYKVYCSMVSGTVSRCDKPAAQTLTTCGKKHLRPGRDKPVIPARTTGDVPAPVAMMGFECSNTQWP